MSGGHDRRASGGGGRKAGWGLPIALSLLAVPATSEEVAVRTRDHGRVEVRATAARLSSVLGRLAALTDVSVAYLGSPPTRLATLEISAASQTEAVLDVLHAFGAGFAVSTDSTGTRILALVVAEAAAGGRAGPEVAAVGSPPDATLPEAAPAGTASPEEWPSDGPPSDPPASDPPSPDAAPPHAAEGGSPEPEGHATETTEGFPVLPGTFVPGVRATGQTTEWGVPPLVLPEPPGPKATEMTGAPREPGPPGAGNPTPAPPSP